MKKVLLIFAFIVSALAAKAVNATVYVQADEAPYLYGWFTIGGKETKINGAWPGKQLTEKTTKKNAAGEDMEFWYMTFNFEETSSFNIIFNNGNTSLMKQTGNITDIASDRYFTYDG
ncbi:MAG: starch-binding protein, partial [Bacteroidales bacterium]|nr:starch-binding protein [Bacteroidales bacterium]